MKMAKAGSSPSTRVIAFPPSWLTSLTSQPGEPPSSLRQESLPGLREEMQSFGKSSYWSRFERQIPSTSSIGQGFFNLTFQLRQANVIDFCMQLRISEDR